MLFFSWTTHRIGQRILAVIAFVTAPAYTIPVVDLLLLLTFRR
jgi:hypothetical protein